MNFQFFNDTWRMVHLHPATFDHGCVGDGGAIEPLTIRLLTLPNNTYPWVKLWDHGDKGGLVLLVLPKSVDEKQAK